MPSWFVALLAGPAVLIPLAAYCMIHRRVKGARWYGILLVTIAWWSLAYAWELSVVDAQTKLLALRVKYFAVVAVPPAWIGFILDFVGSDPRRVRSRVRPLVGVALAVLVLLWSDGRHGLFWGDMTLRDIGPFVVLQGRGPGFWMNVAYTYVVLAAGLVLLVRARGRFAVSLSHPRPHARRRDDRALGGQRGVHAAPRGVDSRPDAVLFTCTALIAALAVFRYDLLEPVPTLRDARIGSVGDGVIILDAHRRVADLNPAAEDCSDAGVRKRRGASSTT